MLNRIKFRKWLKSKSPADIVGYANRPKCCPLATFLIENISDSEPLVGMGSYRMNGVNDEQCTPQWAQRFIEGVDSTRAINAAITADDALTVLDQIE